MHLLLLVSYPCRVYPGAGAPVRECIPKNFSLEDLDFRLFFERRQLQQLPDPTIALVSVLLFTGKVVKKLVSILFVGESRLILMYRWVSTTNLVVRRYRGAKRSQRLQRRMCVMCPGVFCLHVLVVVLSFICNCKCNFSFDEQRGSEGRSESQI